ncbi:MAG: glycoside hydrolase family 9 protein [Lentisphaeria bacterium]|nr:glycoside hydrolase family 9 protein [Lentisphaeria bacterium]
MFHRRVGSVGGTAWSACLWFLGAASLCLAAGPDPVLTGFEGGFDYAFLAWEKSVTVTDGILCIRAKANDGGGGLNVRLDLSDFSEWTPALRLRTRPDNAARRLRLILGDEDGTTHEFSIPLTALEPDRFTLVPAADGAALMEPSESRPGRIEGLDCSRITMLQVQGDWAKETIHVELDRAELLPPTDEFRAQRTVLRERRAAAAEKQRREAEDLERRRQQRLANPEHHADGPTVVHVGPAAADILELVIQEKHLVPTPQVRYEAQAEDTVEAKGANVFAWEGEAIVETRKDVEVRRKTGRKTEVLGHLAGRVGLLKPPEVLSGQPLWVETVADPAAYRVSSSDDPAWRQPHPPVAVAWKRKPNSLFTHNEPALVHHVYLRLDAPLREGCLYRVEMVGLNTREEAVSVRHDPNRTRSESVHVSHIGFRPDDPLKRGCFSVWLGTGGASSIADAPAPAFRLVDAATGEICFQGTVRRLKGATERESFRDGRNYSRTDVGVLEFGGFRREGVYRLCVDGVGCSYPFAIAGDVWGKAFALSMTGLLHHRSGIELGPPVTPYLRPRPMHPEDGFRVLRLGVTTLDGESDAVRGDVGRLRGGALEHAAEAWGGYMDAGDWDRRSAHLEGVTYLLLELYELFPEHFRKVALALPASERANGLPDLLDEALWNLDFHFRLQRADGGVCGGVESTAHPRAGECSWQESLVAGVFAPDPLSSWLFAACAAKFARIAPPEAGERTRTFHAAALNAWEWAETQAESAAAARPPEQQAKIRQAFQKARNLAAVELYRHTAEPRFHTAFRDSSVLADANPEVLRQESALFAYARLPDELADADWRARARMGILKTADDALAFAADNGLGLAAPVPTLPPMGYVGYFSVPGMISRCLPRAYALSGEPKYLVGTLQSCLFAAGANPDNMALTTGLGPNPVRFPLHIDSRNSAQPAPTGITVYGPSDPAENYPFDAWAHTWFLAKTMTPPSRQWPAAESYWDIFTVPSTNEYTVHQTIGPTAYTWGFLAARTATTNR